MKVINDIHNIRGKYIDNFINTKCDYYINNISSLKKYIDGYCYDGYLWDCFSLFTVKDEPYCKHYLKNKNIFYLFWDIHSCEKIFIKNYWKYPKDAVLQVNYAEYIELQNTFPEDIYVFDESFLWSVAFTHEEIVPGERCCYFVSNKNNKDI